MVTVDARSRPGDDHPLVRIEHAGGGSGREPAIEDVTLTIGAGEWIGVVGPGGAGKTTLARVALGLVAPTYGAITRRPGLRTVYAPQSAAMTAGAPATAHAALAQVSRRRPWQSSARQRSAAQRSDIAGVLDRIGLGTRRRRALDWLAGTDRQRVLIGCAMVRRPDLLVLDDPAGGDDAAWTAELLALLAELHADGQAILLLTQDLGIAAGVPRLVCFNRTVVADGPPSEVLHPYFLERTFGTATPGARRR